MFLRNLQAIFFPCLLAIPLSMALNHYTGIGAPNWHYGLLFLVVFCFSLNTVYAYNAGSDNFTQLLIASIVIKLLLALIVILVYSLFDKTGFFNFSLHFISHYVLFTIFEIRYLLYIIKTHPAS